MKRILIAMAIFVVVNVNGQNLVPNPSFEDTIQCPDDLGQIDRTNGWFNAHGSPDFFNSCFSFQSGIGVADVPSNTWGYQQTLSGNAYAGFATRAGGNTGREVMGIYLIDSLHIGTKYFLTFYLNFFQNQNNQRCATNKTGAFFSTQLYSVVNFNSVPIMNQSQIYTDSIISDTLNWVKINGSFIADSNYTYMYLGNLFDDLHSDSILITGGTPCVGYYYIDGICLSSDSSYCATWVSVNNLNSHKVKQVIFPNPYSDCFALRNIQDQILKLEVYNVSGRLYDIPFNTKNKDVEICAPLLPSGLLLLKITLPRENLYYKLIHNSE